MKTKADLIEFALAFALGKVRVKGGVKLSEETRHAMAAETVRLMRANGRWSELDDTLKLGRPGETTPWPPEGERGG